MDDKKFDYQKDATSPMDNYYWIENGLFDYLQKMLKKDENYMAAFKESYKTKFIANEQKVKHLIKNELDKGNVYFTLIVVAAYEIFIEMGTPQQEAVLLADACINIPSRQYIIEGTKKMLDCSEDPFQALVKASKERESLYFGKGFEFERAIDHAYGYVLNIKKCLFHETLKILGRKELQPSLCRMDLGWINAIDPEKHNAQFVRPVTFATKNTCQMWFMRKEKDIIKD